MIVVDASVVVSALVDGGSKGANARARLLVDPDLHAPHVVDLEVGSALRRLVQRGTLDDRTARRALEELLVLPLKRYSHLLLMPRVWELREDLTVYDAAYVCLAEALETVLVTADERVTRAPGLRCTFEVLSAER